MDVRSKSQNSFDENHNSALRDGMAFVSENLDAYGFVSDAYPVVTDRWLMAAHGFETETRTASLALPMVGGVMGLYETVYNGLTLADATTTDLLTHTFGYGTEKREHPVPRYAAALAECVALRVLTQTDGAVAHRSLATRLRIEISQALHMLRETVRSNGLSSKDDGLYTASLAVSCMTEREEGTYVLDWYVAGDYRAFLLDSDGLYDLHLPRTAVITPDDAPEPLGGKQLVIRHPEPFALLLLSASACDATAAEQQKQKEIPGLVWRYRMRMEENLLRILTACTSASEFGARAERFFTGHANGRESASGAMAVFCGDTPFSAFRADCIARLRRLEDMLALLPNGYDDTAMQRLPSRAEAETDYIRRLLLQESEVRQRAADALFSLAKRHREAVPETEPPTPEMPDPLSESIPDYRRLTREQVAEIFALYDCENEADYAGIRRNSEAMREYLSEQWGTLRPVLLAAVMPFGTEEKPVSESVPLPGSETKIEPSSEAMDGDASESGTASPEVMLHRRVADRAFDALQRMNVRLGSLLDRRSATLVAVERTLEKQSILLRTNGHAWLYGHADASKACGFAEHAASALSQVLRSFADTYETTGVEYASLMSAYMTERDRLFSMDAENGNGAFCTHWRDMLNGCMPEAVREACRHAIAGQSEGSGGYLELWDDLCVISAGNGAHYEQIRNRATETRMARKIAADESFRIAAVRASAYADAEQDRVLYDRLLADWGKEVCALLNSAQRGSYRSMLRRWTDACETRKHQTEAYEQYRILYEKYLDAAE